MAKVRVWNITDDTNPDVKPHTRMVLGKVLKPGQAVTVDAARLAKAHKVKRDVEAGFLYIGAKPPASYTAVKRPPRAKADARRVKSDGSFEGTTPVAPAKAHGIVIPPKPEAAAEDKVEVKDDVSVELKPAEEAPVEAAPEEATEEATKEETESGSKKRRRGK
jgi:hypothetical protein